LLQRTRTRRGRRVFRLTEGRVAHRPCFLEVRKTRYYFKRLTRHSQTPTKEAQPQKAAFNANLHGRCLNIALHINIIHVYKGVKFEARHNAGAKQV
jgi:hypothetical protein